MYEDIVREFYAQRLNRVAEALRRNGFEAYVAADKKEAAELVLKLIPENSVVGIGGSVTIRQLGLVEALEKRGFKVVHHWVKASPEEVDELRRKELTADVFLSSSNAITLDGKLVNVDGVGNRVAAMIFGPRRVIVVAGRNKIVRDLEEAMRRARDIAAIMNWMRLGLDNPCLKTGCCIDCDSPTRGCRITVIIEKRPLRTDFHVILVNEDLGF